MKTDTTRKMQFTALFHDKKFQRHLGLFIIFNILLYIWMTFAHTLVPFNQAGYDVNSHHYIVDQRVKPGHSFNLLDALAQYDAQFYLSIADNGYVKGPVITSLGDKANMMAPAYAFAPAYPLLIGVINQVVRSVEVSAFIVTQATLIMGFTLVWWLVARWYTVSLASRTAWLLFAYPISIFYRSYFTEGLFLILLVAFLDSIQDKRWVRAAMSAGFLALTRLVGLGAGALVTIKAFIEWRRGNMNLRKVLFVGLLSAVPLLGFMLFCYINTGNPIYFHSIRYLWGANTPPVDTFQAIASFPSLSINYFHSSKLDVISIVIFGFLVYKSRKWLPLSWWLVALGLWLIPILTTDTMSASRYHTINLPLFVYVAHVLSTRSYRVLLGSCIFGLLFVALLFVNWYWIG